MKQQEIISLLLSIQEHPENYTDEQLRQLFADNNELAETAEQLALTKRALIKGETEKEDVLVDEEWEAFAAKYATDLDVMDEDERQKVAVSKPVRLTGKRSYRIAAGFIGFLFIAGVTFAAIHIIRSNNPKTTEAGTETRTTEDTKVSSVLVTTAPDDTLKNDTTIRLEPFVFDNVPLEEMMSQIATHYDKTVIFSNEDARQLRFYFVWKPDDTLDHVLQRLNLFESIHVEQKEDNIVIE